VIATDVIGSGRGVAFRWATVIGGLVPLLVSQVVMRMEFAEAVALVFALAASTFCPLLVLGIWWRGLTPPGAVAGVATGGVLAGAAILACLAGYDRAGWLGVLMERPAIVSVPAAFLVMVVVSLATRRGCPGATDQLLLRLHAPERLGLSRGVDRPARGPVA
jgi:Na+(H+)/acetate symporter ActP